MHYNRVTSFIIAGLVASGAYAQNVTGSFDAAKKKFTYVVSANSGIASVHITGPTTGDNNIIKGQPAGWSFVGVSQTGDYSWETNANATGTFTFTLEYSTPMDSVDTANVQFDMFDGTGKRIIYDADPTGLDGGTKPNTIPVAAPEPATWLALGLGSAWLARRRRAA